MVNKFILLKEFNGDTLFHINSMFISAILEMKEYRIVKTMDGQNFNVCETISEIFKLIDKSNLYKI